MKNIHLIITSFLFCIFQTFGIRSEKKVQEKNDILPFFESWERRHIQKLMDTQATRKDSVQSDEQENAEFAEFRRILPKNSKKLTKNKKSLPFSKLHNNFRTPKLSQKKNSVKSVNKKYRKKRRKTNGNQRFVNTTLNEINRDSKMSDSKDSNKNLKPVDIIVHIKMND